MNVKTRAPPQSRRAALSETGLETLATNPRPLQNGVRLLIAAVSVPSSR
jgi:hypothetical protein